MDRPCDICGGFTDQGVAYEMIVTCSKCRLSCEHLYCMRDSISYQDREKWVCESCSKEDGRFSPISRIKGDKSPSPANIINYDERHLASPSRFHKSSGWQAHSSRQKAVTSGKVRFITHQEVQQLYRTTSPIKSSAVCKSVAPKSPLSRVSAPSDVTRPRRGRPPKKRNISISEMGSPFSIVRTVTPPRHGKAPKMLSISKINQQASQIMKNSQEKRSPGTHTKRHASEEQPKDASVLPPRAATSSRKILKEPNKLSCTPSSTRDSSLNMSLGGETSAATGEHNHSDGEERELLNISSDLHLYHSSLLVQHATWKGGFLTYDADTPARFFGGFQAQLPSKVHRRVYDFSQKMPPVLQATLLPQLHLWDDPFHDECAELEDVALYFFPDDNIASSRETHASLFEVIMDTKKSVMRIYFEGEDGVELLVYTSKQLRLDLPDTVTCPKTQNFLWGIFRPKGDCQADIGDSATTADMEIDMVGGKMVGSVDVVIPKDLPTPSRMSKQSTSPKETSTSSRMSQQPICPKNTSTPSRTSQQPVVNPKELPTASRMSELQPLMTLRESPTTPSRMSVEPIQTPSSSTHGGMSAVQQLLSVAKGKHPSYLHKKRALETTIAQLLGVNSEETTSTPSAMKTTLALQQVKLEKEEGDTAGTTSTVNVKLEKEEDELGGTSATAHGLNHN